MTAESLHDQARLAMVEHRRHRQELVARGEQPSKLTRRRVRIPLWTVDAAREVLAARRNPDVNEPAEVTTGGHMMAAVLAQLLFWLAGRRKDGTSRAHAPDPERGLDYCWIATTAAELAGQIGARPKQVEHCLPALRDAGWIGYKAMRYCGRGNLRGLVPSHVWLGPKAQDILARISAVSGTPPAMSLDLWAMHAAGGDINAALVLSRLYHLHRLNGRAGGQAGAARGDRQDGAFAVRNEDLADRLLLSLDQVKRAKTLLRDHGLITMPGRSLVGLDVELCRGMIVLVAPDFSERESRSP